MHSWIIFAGMTLLALLLGLNLAFSWKLGGALCRHRRDLDQWRARMDEIRAMMERAKRDTGTVLDKIEDVTAQQVQDWNAVQQEIAQCSRFRPKIVTPNRRTSTQVSRYHSRN